MQILVFSFLFFLFLSMSVGLYSAKFKKKTREDYLLAGRSVGPWTMALSAVATNNSGFMFIGYIGTVYTQGISALWIMFGWLLGDLLTWYFVHAPLRKQSKERQHLTLASFIGGTKSRSQRALTALLSFFSLLFLASYSAAQVSAGSKALHVLFSWDYSSGALIALFMVVSYCFAGGIRASIWTDVIQSMVMFLSMLMLCLVSLYHIGGFSQLIASLKSIDPSLMAVFPQNLRFGFFLYMISWFCAGIGVIGQPHIMVRAMLIRSTSEIVTARRVYTAWNISFTLLSTLVALSARVLLPMDIFDAELALPLLSLQLLPEFFTGFVLAGLFSASISTADSQILSCSASITEDILAFFGIKAKLWMSKLATVLVALLVLAIVLTASSSVFFLVTFAWSGLAISFAPLLLLRLYGYVPSFLVSSMYLCLGLSLVMFWRFILGWSDHVYELLPASLVLAIVYFSSTKYFQDSSSHS